ncbi:MAG TPA: pyruvate kinase [Patescibacteria group bacterium]|nr:pyruvate kinase [Patescibacteria group bacterium]
MGVEKSKSNVTEVAPKVSVGSFKRTKIIATIGPVTNSYEAILGLIKAGANAIRLNFSYGINEDRDQQIVWIRQASQELNKPVAIIQDLQGPKIRLGDFEGVVPVQKGQSLRFRMNADYSREGVFPTQYDLSKKIKRGEQLHLYDGKVRTTVTSVLNSVVHVRAENDGILIARKGINLPDTDFEGDILTEKDRQDIAYGVQHDFDYVALSFVQSAKDIHLLRRQLRNLGSGAKIIAKIETKSATENLEDIIEEADAIMVARGDLAIEIGLESVPILQRKIINLGLKYGRPTIVATQMLASMAESPEPTRAEVSDIATAVLIGTDAMMLSDETAAGQYPLEAVGVMKKIIRYTQDNSESGKTTAELPSITCSRQDAISRAIVMLADSINAAAIIAETKSGATALKIAAQRPSQPIIAVTSNPRVAQQLAILYGCISFIRKDELTQATKLTDWLKLHRVLKKGDMVVTASGRHPGVVGTTDTIKVRVLE